MVCGRKKRWERTENDRLNRPFVLVQEGALSIRGMHGFEPKPEEGSSSGFERNMDSEPGPGSLVLSVLFRYNLSGVFLAMHKTGRTCEQSGGQRDEY